MAPTDPGIDQNVRGTGGRFVDTLLWRNQQHRLHNPPVEVTLTLLIPYVTYLVADGLGASGVLAVVTAGLVLGRHDPAVRSTASRLEGEVFWDMLVFLLNGLIFHRAKHMTISSACFYARITLNRPCQTSGDLLRVIPAAYRSGRGRPVTPSPRRGGDPNHPDGGARTPPLGRRGCVPAPAGSSPPGGPGAVSPLEGRRHHRVGRHAGGRCLSWVGMREKRQKGMGQHALLSYQGCTNQDTQRRTRMAHPEEVSQWTATVAKEIPQLSPAQARVLALWSYGMVLTPSCACHTIALFLGLVSGEGYHALRQRVREYGGPKSQNLRHFWCIDWPPTRLTRPADAASGKTPARTFDA